MATVANSLFFKADTRIRTVSDNTIVLSSRYGDGVDAKDIFLQPDEGMKLPVTAGCFNIIFPVVGSIMLHNNTGAMIELLPEHVYCCAMANGGELWIENPFPDETVNFLHISFPHPAPGSFAAVSDIGIAAKNKLFSGAGVAACVKAGVYDSRTKDIYKLTSGKSGLFTYVINGSFDFEERLMEHRDGLYQWHVDEVEFEALSETAIILMIEC